MSCVIQSRLTLCLPKQVTCIQKWIEDGWLLPYDEHKYGPAKGLIPLMAIVQRNKKKVRSVMDFRELNAHIDVFMADSDVCSDRLREWQRQGVNVCVIYLAKAYFQIKIHDSLWPYQTVNFKGPEVLLNATGIWPKCCPIGYESSAQQCSLTRSHH